MTVEDIPEGQHADLALPGNPIHMPPHHLHAYYHNIFDPDVPDSKRFQWKPAPAAGNYIPPTILIAATREDAATPEQSTKKQTAARKQRSQPVKRVSLPKKATQPSRSAVDPEESEMSTESDTTDSSDPDSTGSDDSEDSEHLDDAERSFNDQQMERLPVVLKTGRVSKAPGSHPPMETLNQHPQSQGQDEGKAVDPTERTFTTAAAPEKAVSTSGPSHQVEPAIENPRRSPGTRPGTVSDLSRSVWQYRPSNGKLVRYTVRT